MFTFDEKSVARIRKVVRDAERTHRNGAQRPKRREFHPYRIVLCKIQTGQSLTTTASDSALCFIMVGDPGSETEAEEITVYSGRLMVGGTTINAGDYLWAGWVNGYWQVFAAACG